jgi:hypothetical protein
VEGLSVAAITYYVVGLVGYVAKGAHGLGWPLGVEASMAIAVPVVALIVWAGLRRLHHRIVDTDATPPARRKPQGCAPSPRRLRRHGRSAILDGLAVQAFHRHAAQASPSSAAPARARGAPPSRVGSTAWQANMAETGIQSAPAAINSRAIGIALAAVGAIGFSGKAIIVKLAYRYGGRHHPADVPHADGPAFLRADGLVGRARTPGAAPRRALGGAGPGFCGYYLASMLDFVGLQHISAGLERLILYLTPTLVLVYDWAWRGRPITPGHVLATLVSYGGALLVFGFELHAAPGGATAWGALWVLGSAASYALYLFFSGQFVRRIGALRLVGLASTVASLCCIAHFALVNPLDAARGRARAVAVAAQRHAVHRRAGADGDDGHRAHRRRPGRAGGHDRAAVHHRHGRVLLGEPFTGPGGGHGAGGGRHRAVQPRRPDEFETTRSLNHGLGYCRQMGAGVRRQQGPGPGLRAGAGARA